MVFVKGKSGNPNGRAKTPAELKDCTPTEMRLLIWKLWKYDKFQLKNLLERENAQMGELMIASVIAKAVKMGDPVRLEALMSRLVGKVKDVVELEGNMTFQLPTREEALQSLAEDYAITPAIEGVKDEELA